MKKGSQKEILINTLARKVGHAAGAIAKATRGLAEDAAALVRTDKAQEKPTKTSKRRSTPKKKTRVARTCLWRIPSFLKFPAFRHLVMPRARGLTAFHPSSTRPSPVASTLRHPKASSVSHPCHEGRHFRFLGNQAAMGV